MGSDYENLKHAESIWDMIEEERHIPPEEEDEPYILIRTGKEAEELASTEERLTNLEAIALVSVQRRLDALESKLGEPYQKYKIREELNELKEQMDRVMGLVSDKLDENGNLG